MLVQMFCFVDVYINHRFVVNSVHFVVDVTTQETFQKGQIRTAVQPCMPSIILASPIHHRGNLLIRIFAAVNTAAVSAYKHQPELFNH